LWIEPEAHARRDQLPGKIRQRIKQIDSFASQPRPSISQPLDIEGLEVPPGRNSPRPIRKLANYLCNK
jgi:hypothetical protein